MKKTIYSYLLILVIVKTLYQSIHSIDSTSATKCGISSTTIKQDDPIFSKLESLLVSNWLISAKTYDNGADVLSQNLFEFSLCQSVSTFCQEQLNSSGICKLTNSESNHIAKSIIIGYKSTLQLARLNEGYLLNSTGFKCTPDLDYKTTIYFRCGKTIGIPHLLNKFISVEQSSEEKCTLNFEWETSQACQTNNFKSINEIPCYLTSTELSQTGGIKTYITVDFNPLILSGSTTNLNRFESFHRVVEFNDDLDIGLNLCRYESSGNKLNKF